MKKILIIAIFISICGISFGQNSKTKQMLSKIEGEWELDDNNNVTYVKVIEAPELSKDEIFSRALNYFVYNYGSGKSVIQTQDKELGRIVGKGVFPDVYVYQSLVSTYFSTTHILRIDIKEGRARIIISLTEVERKVGGDTPPTYHSHRIASQYPIIQYKMHKNQYGRAFYRSHLKALATIDNLEKAIQEGNVSKSIDDEW